MGIINAFHFLVAYWAIYHNYLHRVIQILYIKLTHYSNLKLVPPDGIEPPSTGS